MYQLTFKNINSNLTFTITDRGTPPLTTITVVTINVVNVEEHSPMFAQTQYTFDDVPNNSPIGTPIGTLSATDEDGESLVLFCTELLVIVMVLELLFYVGLMLIICLLRPNSQGQGGKASLPLPRKISASFSTFMSFSNLSSTES